MHADLCNIFFSFFLCKIQSHLSTIIIEYDSVTYLAQTLYSCITHSLLQISLLTPSISHSLTLQEQRDQVVLRLIHWLKQVVNAHLAELDRGVEFTHAVLTLLVHHHKVEN